MIEKIISHTKKINSYTIILILLLSLMSCSQSSSPPSFLYNSGDYPILVVGDSLSAGYRMSDDKTWVSLLEKQLKSRGWINASQQIANVSVSGQTSKDGLDTLPDYLANFSPSLVIIQLGANDALRRQSMEDMEKNLSQAIELSQSSGAKVLLVGVDLPSKFFFVSTKNFTSVYDKLAKEHDVYYLDNLLEGVNSNSKYMLEDNLHPNELGQPIIMENVLSKLEDI